jgi:acyl-coenzyme A synthetase/AMP-(fatty) acid ligase
MVANASSHDISDLGGQDVHDLTSVSTNWIDPVSVPVDIRSLIIFTSGSTGRPKGIVRQGWHSDAGWATLSRDGGKTAIFGSLHLSGGMGALNRAVVAGSARLIDVRHRDPEDIIQELSAHDVTHLSVTPSVMSLFAHSEMKKV